MTDGPKVFNALPVGAGVPPRHMVAQPRHLCRGRGGGVDPDRSFRLPGDEAGASDLLRRTRLRRAVDPGRPRRLCPDLAERIPRYGTDAAGLPDPGRPARLSGLSRPAVPQ